MKKYKSLILITSTALIVIGVIVVTAEAESLRDTASDALDKAGSDKLHIAHGYVGTLVSALLLGRGGSGLLRVFGTDGSEVGAERLGAGRDGVE